MSTPRPASLTFRIIKADYLATLVIVPLVFWAMYLVLRIFGVSSGIIKAANAPYYLNQIFAWVLVFTIICISGAIWRITAITSLFKRGTAVMGYVTLVRFSRGRSHVEHTYIYEGQEYDSAHVFMGAKETIVLQQGDQVALVVDSANPRRALIRDLYV